MKNPLFFLLSTLFALNTSIVKPIIDGRFIPVDLENTYTFTPFEWAKGCVSFEKGLEVPAESSIFIGVNQPIKGIIYLNGGTIVLTRDMELSIDSGFSGNGNIQTNGHNLIIKSDTGFDGVVTINGQGIQPNNIRKIDTLVLTGS